MKCLILIVLIVIISSCVYSHTDSIQELGNDYYYLADANESQILLGSNNDENRKNGGVIIIPPTVLKYKYDNRYIVAKSKMINNYRYWIIDKLNNNSKVYSMDSISFYNTIVVKKIKLDLE